MLTKADLSQIRKIFREEQETEKEEFRGEMKLWRIELQKEIRDLKDHFKNLEIKINKIQKDIKIIINFFDRENLEFKRRPEKLEEHLYA